MLDLEENKRNLAELQDKLTKMAETLQISKLKEDFTELEQETLKPDFWEDTQKSATLFSQMNAIQKKIRNYENLRNELDNLLELNELLLLEKDDSLEKDLVSNTQKLEQKLSQLEIQTLLSGKYDVSNAILTIHPGARTEPNPKIGLKCFIVCTPDGLPIMAIP